VRRKSPFGSFFKYSGYILELENILK
jgi:hypothetical protein